jgi:hypothetical protein
MDERKEKLEDLLEGTEEEKRLAKERVIAYVKLLIDWDEQPNKTASGEQTDHDGSAT